MVNLSEYECIYNQGVLHKYARRSDGAIFSVKTYIAPEKTKPENHPTIQSILKVQPHSHPNLPRYFGCDTKEADGFTEIYAFFEDSEGSLADYLKQNRLTKEEAIALAQQLIDVSIFVDRNAYHLPSYYTPYNIMVVKDTGSGRTLFKPFGFLVHDDARRVGEEDLKWTAPELYERQKLKRVHLAINAEKAVFYSIGIIVLFSITEDMITNGRDAIEPTQFTSTNQKRETEAGAYARAKVASQFNDNQLIGLLERILTYSDKERCDFRVWQLILKDIQAGVKSKGVKVQKGGKGGNVIGSRVDYNQGYNGGGYNANAQAQGHGKKSKKNACCAGCNVF